MTDRHCPGCGGAVTGRRNKRYCGKHCKKKAERLRARLRKLLRRQLDYREQERQALRGDIRWAFVRLIRARRERERLEAVEIADRLGIVAQPVSDFTGLLLATPVNQRTFAESATLDAMGE